MTQQAMDFKKRPKRPISHPYKKLSDFADAKQQHAAHPELAYVFVTGSEMWATDAYRLLHVEFSQAEDPMDFGEELKLVPVEFFKKFESKENVPQSLSSWLELSTFPLPEYDEEFIRGTLDGFSLSADSSFVALRERFLDRVEAVLKSSKDTGIHLELLHGVLRLKAVSAGGIETKTELAIQEGPSGVVAFSTRINPDYLKHALDAIPTDHIQVDLVTTDDLYAFIIRPVEEHPTRVTAMVALSQDE